MEENFKLICSVYIHIILYLYICRTDFNIEQRKMLSLKYGDDDSDDDINIEKVVYMRISIREIRK